MSTSETVTLDADVCPCGRGKILKHVTTQDNPWRSADITYELDCEICRAGWVIEGSGVALVPIKSAAEADAAYNAWSQSRQPLRDLVRDVVNQYFARFGAKSKKAEWQEMLRLDIYTGSYRNYLKSKSEGHSSGEISYALRNRPWLLSLTGEHSCTQKLTQLLETCDARKKEWEAAARQFIRRPLDPPKSLR